MGTRTVSMDFPAEITGNVLLLYYYFTGHTATNGQYCVGYIRIGARRILQNNIIFKTDEGMTLPTIEISGEYINITTHNVAVITIHEYPSFL